MINQISQILQERNLQKFVGLKEGPLFDCKSKKAYDLESKNGRYELAKDVSAFANCDGGLIIIGLVTKVIIEDNAEVVSGLDLMIENEFDKEKYRGIIAEYTHPKIGDLKIDWVEDKIKIGLGVGYIHIPKQDETRKWFMIKKLMDGDEKIKGIVFGIVKRVGASSDPFTINQVDDAIKNGRTPSAERITRIEEKIDYLIAKSEKKFRSSPAEKLDERINEMLAKE